MPQNVPPEAGMKDAIAYLDGDKTKGVATVVEVPNLDVAKVREKTGLSQDRFAGAFAINPSTLRNWEQGRTRPDGAARVLLTVIDRDPEAVLRALRIGAKPHLLGRSELGSQQAATLASFVRSSARVKSEGAGQDQLLTKCPSGTMMAPNLVPTVRAGTVITIVCVVVLRRASSIGNGRPGPGLLSRLGIARKSPGDYETRTDRRPTMN